MSTDISFGVTNRWMGYCYYYCAATTTTTSKATGIAAAATDAATTINSCENRVTPSSKSAGILLLLLPLLLPLTSGAIAGKPHGRRFGECFKCTRLRCGKKKKTRESLAVTAQHMLLGVHTTHIWDHTAHTM